MIIAGHTEQQGVTIVELMIATAVFSVVLLIIIYAFMFVTDDYVKGYIQSFTQATARSIEQQVATDIELSNGYIGPTQSTRRAQGYCIADHRYSFALNKEYTGSPSHRNGLLVDTPNGGCTSSTFPLPVLTSSVSQNSQELLDKNMALTCFCISPLNMSNRLYKIEIEVAYGSPPYNGNCSSGSSCSTSVLTTGSCPPLSLGGNFCAYSTLQADVQQRIVGGN